MVLRGWWLDVRVALVCSVVVACIDAGVTPAGTDTLTVTPQNHFQLTCFALAGTAHGPQQENVSCDECHKSYPTFADTMCLVCHTKTETDDLHTAAQATNPNAAIYFFTGWCAAANQGDCTTDPQWGQKTCLTAGCHMDGYATPGQPKLCGEEFIKQLSTDPSLLQ